MKTVRELLNFILRQDGSIVFGDLSRYPQHLIEALKSIPLLTVVIITKDESLYSSENRIKILPSVDKIEKCDLLVYLEPDSLQIVKNYSLALRVAVFTSHFTFKTMHGSKWTNICFFLKIDPEGTKKLLEKREFPVQTQNVGLVKINHVNVLTLQPGTSPFITDNTYIVLDLTKYKFNVLNTYLAFWNAFDFMLEHNDLIYQWLICFPEHGYQAFTRFTQNILDNLVCKTFEHGNVTDRKTIISLLPFYKQGVLYSEFDIDYHFFGGMKYIVPKTLEDACKAAAKHNVYPLVSNVLGIKT